MSRGSRGRRYEEPKLNMKKVFAVILAIIVIIMVIFIIKGVLTKNKEQGKIASKDYFAAFKDNKFVCSVIATIVSDILFIFLVLSFISFTISLTSAVDIFVLLDFSISASIIDNPLSPKFLVLIERLSISIEFSLILSKLFAKLFISNALFCAFSAWFVAPSETSCMAFATSPIEAVTSSDILARFAEVSNTVLDELEASVLYTKFSHIINQVFIENVKLVLPDKFQVAQSK